MSKLWEVVNWLINDVVDHDDDKLILEPDDTTTSSKEKVEQSVAANIAGVTLPIGKSTSKKASCCKKK